MHRRPFLHEMKPRGLLPTGLLLLLSCQAPGGAPQAWQRFDLLALSPALQEVALPLGPEEVRPQLPAAERLHVARLPAAEVRAFSQPGGSRVRWRLRLGERSYFSFVPLGKRGADPLRYRVAVRLSGGAERQLFAAPAPAPGRFAPATVTVDLSPFAGQRIDLLLEAESTRGAVGKWRKGRLFWGSPAVYGRTDVADSIPSEPPSVLLLGIDTLRADGLGAYGRRPSVTPALDRLAAESDVWLEAFSCFNVTNPSFTSLMTGLYGKNHGIYDFGHPLPAHFATLAERFSAAGYDTASVVSVNHLADAQSGLGQGFATREEAADQFAAERVVDRAMDWIGERRKPFFLWLHFFDPHTPHTPPQPFAQGFRQREAVGLSPARDWIGFRKPGFVPYENPVLGGQKDLYAGEIAYLDRQLDRLLDFLSSRGLLENTVVVLIADHGENLDEHGISFRHSGLWDTVTHVPLLIRWPGRKPEGRRIAGLVQNVDVAPTLLRFAGLPVPASDGLDLLRLPAAGRRAVFAEHTGKLGAMVRTRRYKYMISRPGNRFVPPGAYFYDLTADPREEKNLAGQHLPEEERLAEVLRRWWSEASPSHPGTPARPDGEQERRLRSLGYE